MTFVARSPRRPMLTAINCWTGGPVPALHRSSVPTALQPRTALFLVMAARPPPPPTRSRCASSWTLRTCPGPPPDPDDRTTGAADPRRRAPGARNPLGGRARGARVAPRGKSTPGTARPGCVGCVGRPSQPEGAPSADPPCAGTSPRGFRGRTRGRARATRRSRA